MKAFYDLHLHSCLSPCGDNDMTPRNIAGMAALLGLQVIAVADHNTCRHCPAVLSAARGQGILAVPAMELTTAEEVHVLCLFPDLDAAMDFDKYVYSKLPDIPNNERIFGEQLLLDDDENVLGREPRLLLSATGIGIYDAVSLVKSYGGAAVPAHIDRPSFSVLSNLGLWDANMGFAAYEIFDISQRDALEARFPDLKNIRCISDSDAHYLENMRDAEHALDLERLSARAVVEHFS
ncbi:histidinol-phosphatase [Clostridia bacterium]|nr:histidinol-phosphatase [Clostridia bacterium]GHV31625.1 histidinol-phosphatase [Clostridia bacterium]